MQKWKISAKKEKIQKEPNGNFRSKKYNNQNLRGSMENLNNRIERTEEIISNQESRIKETA